MVERVPLAALGALVGFCLGWVSARLTEWFEADESANADDDGDADEPGFSMGPARGPAAEPYQSGTASEVRGDGAAGGRLARALVRDPLVQGGCALLWGAAFLLLDNGAWWRPIEAGLIGVPLVQVAVTDLRSRYVYTVVAAVGLIVGLACGWHLHDVAWFWSVLGALGGWLGFGALWLLGKILYRGTEPLARGDITIGAMVGAGAAACAAQALIAGVLLGGLFAIGMLVVRRSRHEFMPYGPGLCVGGVLALFVC